MATPSSAKLKLVFETAVAAAETYKTERSREFKGSKGGWFRMTDGRRRMQEHFNNQIAAVDMAIAAMKAAAKIA